MDARGLRATLLGLGLLGLACGGPTVVFPGGALSGPVKAAPTSFAFAESGDTIQLETNPTEPYSVNITAAIVGEDLYVSAGDNHATWARNLDADPLARVRIDGDVYELRATRVRDASELDAFAEVWLENAWARDPRGFDEVFVYKLGPR